MNRLLRTFALIAIASVSSARADIVLSIDMDTQTAGFQNSIDVTVGQTIIAGVNLQITESSINGLGGYSMSVLFDSNVLDLGPDVFEIPNPNPPPFGNINVNRLATPPENWATLGDQSANANEEGPIPGTTPPLSVFYDNTGAFFNVAAGATSGGVGPGTNISIFEFTLKATQAGTISSNLDGDPSVILALYKPSDGFLDAANNLIPFSQIQGVVGPAAIPEASTFSFLGIGAMLSGVVYLRKRKLVKSRVA